MRRNFVMAVLAVLTLPACAAGQAGAAACAPDNAGVKVPAGFCVSIFADSVKGARHMVVAPNGDLVVSMQRPGEGVLVLRDPRKTGHADERKQFSTGYTTSEVALFDNHLYTEAFPRSQGRGGNGAASTISILRYPLTRGEVTPAGPPDTIVSGLPGGPGHTTRNFTITRDGVMYVNIGSKTNSCQDRDRAAAVPGANPCIELDTRAGIWRFDARAQHQTPSASNHFARGIRNAVGIAMSPLDGKLWTTQHGRDQLGDWAVALGLTDDKDMYNAENPAEELLQVNQGDDFGWPYCYYAVGQRHLVQAPEYGGDGRKLGDCANKKEPVATFPAHWAPNALFFYTGSAFPARYKNGAFIAFHGSWNRAPEPQAGYNVVFQPLTKDGKAAGNYEVFAGNFSPNVGAGRANAATGAHRPTGFAQGLDGSLYVSDDTGGRIYRIIYTGR
ncbi:MAG: PQQ-dependent sugar dehydrogenase [Gemmatimonadaceae bacterium]